MIKYYIPTKGERVRIDRMPQVYKTNEAGDVFFWSEYKHGSDSWVWSQSYATDTWLYRNDYKEVSLEELASWFTERINNHPDLQHGTGTDTRMLNFLLQSEI